MGESGGVARSGKCSQGGGQRVSRPVKDEGVKVLHIMMGGPNNSRRDGTARPRDTCWHTATTCDDVHEGCEYSGHALTRIELLTIEDHCLGSVVSVTCDSAGGIVEV